MMKRRLAIILIFVVIFGLTACAGQSADPDSVDRQSGLENTEQQTDNEEKISDAELSSDDTQSDDVPVITNTDNAEAAEVAESVPVVYMTTDISPEGLMAVYEALGWTPEGTVAVKLSTGEPPSSNYLRPELIADLVKAVDGTIVECNTAYGGSRAETAMHYQVAEDHGFTEIADCGE